VICHRCKSAWAQVQLQLPDDPVGYWVCEPCVYPTVYQLQSKSADRIVPVVNARVN
jgi:hypothetical protein